LKATHGSKFLNLKNFPKKLQRLKILDHILLFFIICLSILPITRLPIGQERGINIEVPIQLLIFLILILRILLIGLNKNILPLLFFSIVAGFYFIISPIIGITYSLAFTHLRNYFPFFLGCLLLTQSTTILLDKALLGLTIGIGMSALLMIYIQYINPDLLLMVYMDQYNVYSGLISWGRAFWLGTPASLISILAIFNSYLFKPKIKVFIYLGCICSSLGLIASFTRTSIFAGIGLVIVLFFYSYIFRNGKKIKKILIFLLIGIIFCLSVWFFFKLDNRLYILFQNRVINLISGTANIDLDIHTRKLLFEEYINRFTANPIFGQGLGVPFSYSSGISYWADITLVSFILPFGLLGLFSIILYFFVLFKMILYSKVGYLKKVTNSILVLACIGIAISLNDDIWSHKSFVIYFSMIASVLYTNAKVIRNSYNEKKHS
jgi:hypothetical protein